MPKLRNEIHGKCAHNMHNNNLIVPKSELICIAKQHKHFPVYWLMVMGKLLLIIAIMRRSNNEACEINVTST